MRVFVLLAMVAGCGAGGVPGVDPCATLTGIDATEVHCSVERSAGSALAKATFGDGTEVVIVTEPAMTGVRLSPQGQGVTFSVYPVTCPSWSGSLTIDDTGDSYAFDLTCTKGGAPISGYLRSEATAQE